MKPIPLSSPDITDRERRAVLNVLKTNTLSLGPKVREFEEKIAQYAGRKYGIAVNSGTAALHLIVRSMGIGKGDEVITTPFSFIASSNCFVFEGAKPVFVDIDEKTLCIDPAKIEQAITPRTKAILAVDVFGHPADWSSILKIAKKHNLMVIEDSAEAIGGEHKGKRCGSFGDASIFSFYPNKQITTGEGGIIVTDSQEIADLCRSMVNQGRRVEGGKWLEHVRLGYNYRMPEMEGALGLVQLSRLNSILRKRANVAKLYTQKFKTIKGIEVPFVSPETKMSWFVYVIRLSRECTKAQRDSIVKRLGEQGIASGVYFQTIHLQPFYQTEFGFKKGMFPVAESASERTIALPFFSNLTQTQVNSVVKALGSVIGEVLGA